MKAPYKILFSNDTTNIRSCTSPYHAKGAPFRPEQLEASVDEVAGTGVAAHFIQLAHGQVPWYQSHVYPMAEHLAWWKAYFGSDPLADDFRLDSVHRFLLDGGDLLQVFIDRCRKTGQAPFVSLRMNDVHHVEHIETPGNTKGVHAISRFYVEHLDCRLGSNPHDWLERTLDWSRVDVRDYMFSLIEEQCENYDIAGFELDFMRFPSFFHSERTTSEERANIMTDFVARVRRVLDRTARQDQHRWLCVRIPAFQCVHDRLGIDLLRWVEAGVEMINLSYHFFTQQDGDFAAIRKRVPDAAVYVEMCHTTRVGPVVGARDTYDNFSYRRTTPSQFQTTAHLAYARGLDGVSAFNFVYYREHGDGERGPFDEPPFDVFNHLDDPDRLARQPQHYFLSDVWNTPRVDNRQLPRELGPGDTAAFTLDMAPPVCGAPTDSERGWQHDGRLRIQSPTKLGQSRWAAGLNGVELAATDDRSEPYNNPYSPLLGTSEHHRAWTVPAALLKDGVNAIDITLLKGDGPATIVFLDVVADVGNDRAP